MHLHHVQHRFAILCETVERPDGRGQLGTARFAAPCSKAVIAPHTPWAASESYGTPLAMIRLPRFE